MKDCLQARLFNVKPVVRVVVAIGFSKLKASKDLFYRRQLLRWM